MVWFPKRVNYKASNINLPLLIKEIQLTRFSTIWSKYQNKGKWRDIINRQNLLKYVLILTYWIMNMSCVVRYMSTYKYMWTQEWSEKNIHNLIHRLDNLSLGLGWISHTYHICLKRKKPRSPVQQLDILTILVPRPWHSGKQQKN